jgi:hypothetical protein
MKQEFRPEPDPSGALQPPDRVPPTAVGAGTPSAASEPDPESRPSVRLRRIPSPALIMLKLVVALPLLGFELGRRVVRQLVRR